jgi:hypothetical protein
MPYFSEDFINTIKGVNLMEANAKPRSLADHVDTANSWAMGGGEHKGALLTFGTHGGQVHDEDHRKRLLGEIGKNLGVVNSNRHVSEYNGEAEKLSSLQDYVKGAKISPISEYKKK